EGRLSAPSKDHLPRRLSPPRGCPKGKECRSGEVEDRVVPAGRDECRSPLPERSLSCRVRVHFHAGEDWLNWGTGASRVRPNHSIENNLTREPCGDNS